MLKLVFSLVLACAAALQGAWAQLQIPHQEGEFLSGSVTIQHGFRLGKTTSFPLPVGRWVVRVKEPIQSGQQAPQDGVLLWLEQSDASQVQQLISLTIHDSRNLSWGDASLCKVGLLSSPRGSSLSGGCFALVGTQFAVGAEGSRFDKVRAAWFQEGLKAPGNTVTLQGMADSYGGAVVYFFHRMPAQGNPMRSYFQKVRGQQALSVREAALTDWYRAYGSSIVNAVTGSALAVDSAALAASPVALKNRALAAPEAPVAVAQAQPAISQEPPLVAAPDLGALKAERERLAQEVEAERKRRQELEARLAQDRREAEQKREQERKIAEERLAQETQRLAEVQRLQALEQARKQAAEKRLADEKRQAEQERAALQARQREDQLAAQMREMREMREQLQRLQTAVAAAPAAPVASAPSAPPPALPAATSGRRLALVIGNDGYQAVPALLNARSDARAMASALQAAGFVVSLRLDLTERGMKEALRSFRMEIQGGDEVVVFFAGHGVQLGPANFLLPVDIRGDSEEQVRDEAIPLQRILDDLSDRKARFSLAIVDACRDNPFKSSGRAIGGRGLAPASAASGQMVIFSAGAGQQALDRLGDKDKDPNGLFTRVFVKEMSKPGVPLDRVVRTVRNAVVQLAKTVGHEQVPALYDQTLGDFFFIR